ERQGAPHRVDRLGRKERAMLVFIPIEHVEVVRDDVAELVSLLEDGSRRWGAPAFLFVRDEGAPQPFYYVFGEPELDRLMQRLAAEPGPLERLSRDRLLELLDIHEYTRAEVVGTESAEPDGPAAVLDERGALTGVWAAPVVIPMAGPPPPPEPPTGSQTANGGRRGPAAPPPPPPPAPDAPPRAP